MSMNKSKFRISNKRQLLSKPIILHFLVLCCFLNTLTPASNAAEGSAPVLLSVLPTIGASAVPLSTQIEFHFDQPMKKHVDLGGTPPLIPGPVMWFGLGFDTAGFTYSWSADARTLLCSYSGALPANTAFN